MVQELRLFKYVNGINDMPFPNNESDDEQIVITSFTYNAQRMAATPTITASVEYPRCLDNDWDVNVYAEYNGEKYYIRQIPSSSKNNTSLMYKHDITLYSERFVLENIYFVNVDQNEDTSVYVRCDLMGFADIINKSLENSNLPYRVSVDSSVQNSEKAKETKDITLENVYLSAAIQEIYNQWEIPFYFEGTNIVVKDCSENITDVTLAYGADESLLSIKKNNANFRKITRISGYGSDKNIPFYYPNWSQKGVIDATPLESNSILTKNMLTITDMKRFDKKMPLNGNVKYLVNNETRPIYDNATLNKNGLKYKNQTSTKQIFTIPFESKRENNSIVDIYFDVDIYEEVFPTINSQYLYYDEGVQVLADMLHSPVDFNNSFLTPKNTSSNIKDITKGVSLIPCNATLESSEITSSMNMGNEWKGRLDITRKLRICLTCQSVPKGEYIINIASLFNVADTIKKQEKIGYYYKNYGTIFQKQKDYFATLNQEKNFIDIKLSNFSIVYPTSDATKGWYLNETKKIDLSDIGISINGTPNDSWNGEGFYQEMISKIPTMPHLMPPLYRDSVGERKFYNAINNTYEKEDGSYYEFETEWSESNQNEHIQEFADIYPSITNVTNANGDFIDEILEVAFDDNDNNEVDEEGKFLHPYFYVKIPITNGDKGFNLFDHKIVGGNMQVAMTRGDCAACTFEIQVLTQAIDENYEEVRNPILANDNTNTLPSGDHQQKVTILWNNTKEKQQDSSKQSIWLVLKKDNETFNETYPNKDKGVLPKAGDKFVLLNIDMPKTYVLEAEEKLRKEIIKYMSQNNSDKWIFDIDFSRIFLQENVSFYERLDENCKLNVRYNGETYNFYVNNYKYEVKANEALPKITVGLVDTITINRGITQNIVDGVIEAINQVFDIEENPIPLEEQFLRKTLDETMPNNMTFEKDVVVKGKLETNIVKSPNIQSPLYGGDEVMGTGFKLEEDEQGNSTLTVDNINVRKKIKATEFIIQQIQFQGGIVIQSAAAMECNQVETLENGNFKCYFDTKEGSVSNQFMLDDLARCQRVGYAPKYYWRKVIEVGSDYIVLSNVDGEYENNSDTPSEGDIIVQMGNTTNTDRQSAIEMNTVGENSPSFIMYSGINSFSLVEKDITGIVYHQKVIDENGNVTVEAYPELFSYGAMYFGDRNKKENFIQYQPNPNGTYEMQINAKTEFKSGNPNILNGAIIVNFEIDKADGYKNIKFKPNNNEEKYLTTPLKANTDYVFSIEYITLKEGSITPENIAIAIFDSTISTIRKVWAIPYADNKLIYKFTTPSTIQPTDVLLIYDGQNGSTIGVGYTAFGVKLTEGTTYTGWEGTSTEQQALMALNNAMQGSTDIIGGLVMTNLIGMKGYGEETDKIKAGISGLNENDKLRFWAGSSSWDDASTSKFRVYDDGRVFGTHFYGFEPAIEINNDNYDVYSPYGMLSVDVLGSKVLLNFSGNIMDTTTQKFITLPVDERYIGAEIEIFNPSSNNINLCSFIPEISFDDFYKQEKTNTNDNYYYFRGYNWAYIKKVCAVNDYKTYKYIKLKCVPTQMILMTNDAELTNIMEIFPTRILNGYCQFYFWVIEKYIE